MYKNTPKKAYKMTKNTKDQDFTANDHLAFALYHLELARKKASDWRFIRNSKKMNEALYSCINLCTSIEKRLNRASVEKIVSKL
jgi:hypothetical protein